MRPQILRFLSVLLAFAGVGAAQEQAIVVPADTRFRVRLETALNSRSSQIGDPIRAVLIQPIRDGRRVALAADSLIEGRVQGVQKKEEFGYGGLRLVFDQITLPRGSRIPAQLSASVSASPPSKVKRTILVFAGTIGLGYGISGRGRRVSGVLGGIVAGVSIIANTGRSGRDLELKPGREIVLRLGSNIELR